MQALTRMLKDMGYERADLIDTTNEEARIRY